MHTVFRYSWRFTEREKNSIGIELAMKLARKVKNEGMDNDDSETKQKSSVNSNSDEDSIEEVPSRSTRNVLQLCDSICRSVRYFCFC